MNTIKYVGEYGCADRKSANIERSYHLMDKVKPVVERQCQLRGSDKPFTFKAHGVLWYYRPVVQS